MTCRKVQSLITPFIYDKLNNIKEMEEFIEHVQSCPECREELEVYYALLTAMEQLDTDKTLSDNFSLELKNKLEKEQEKIVHSRFLFFQKKIRLLLMILIIVFILSFRYTSNHIQPRDLLPESNFRLRIMFRENRKSSFEADLQNYMEQQKLADREIRQPSDR